MAGEFTGPNTQRDEGRLARTAASDRALLHPAPEREGKPGYDAPVDETSFQAWLAAAGIEGPRRVARESESSILVSKFEAGFAARLYQALDALPELFDQEEVARRYSAQLPVTARVEAWRLAVNGLLEELGQARGLDRDQLAEIRAGTDSVAALLDSVLWTCPALGDHWQPSPAEREACEDALAKMDDESSIFTRYYGDFEGKRVENHCPGAPVARRLFGQAWAVCAAGD